MNIVEYIAKELDARTAQVNAAIDLLDSGATVPFVARYRKEATGGLDDSQLRNLETRLTYLRELEDRRASILSAIEKQGKLTSELQKTIELTDSKTRLEDLYLPYKPKRRTKAQIAKEAGLQKLLDTLLENVTLQPELLAQEFINPEKGLDDAASVLDGAKHILMERVMENADLIGELRNHMADSGKLDSQVLATKKQDGQKFSDYFDFHENYNKIPSHRALALFRGRNEGVLRIKLKTDDDIDKADTDKFTMCEGIIAKHLNIRQSDHPASPWLTNCVKAAWRIKASLQIETDLFVQLKDRAENEAIRVFAANLRDLLLASPAGSRVSLGLDPGLRTGVKVVVIDNTGKLLEHTTIFPHAPKHQWEESQATLVKLIKKHKVELISIGNGTASRETDKLAQEILKRNPELKLTSIVVSEAGASVYSASELASKEFPNLDVSFRGAVSIARRLQDPLAELVKIEPRSIGVGQYQHDLNQQKLGRSLSNVVEDCVNAVGVDANTASVPLLAHVAGLSETSAANIVSYREQNGAFSNRKQLLKVPRLGPKAYEQCAGFLRINGGDNPLDASAVHPEAYPVVNKIRQSSQRKLSDIIGDSTFLKALSPKDFIDSQFGEPTIIDIIKELDKPGRDPRPEFKTAKFKDGIEKISDLRTDMQLEGVVTNVTNFGAFIDIGVHQDGLVHISQICDRFIKDPREVIKAGDIVKVRVLDIDESRKRIALSMRGLN